MSAFNIVTDTHMHYSGHVSDPIIFVFLVKFTEYKRKVILLLCVLRFLVMVIIFFLTIAFRGLTTQKNISS